MIRILLLYLASFLLFSQSCFGLEVTFRPKAAVDGVSITLKDIVNFDTDSELSKALGSQIISVAPSPGRNILLQSEKVKNYLLNTLPIPDNVQWRGPATILVHRNGITIGPDKIESIVAEFIRNRQNNLPQAKIRFIPKSLPLPFILPAGNLTWEVIPSDPGILSSSSISIIFYVDGHVRKNMAIQGKIRAMAQVLVAISSIPRGNVITADRIRIHTKDISDSKSPFLDPKELIGKKANRTIREDSVIEHSWIDIPPMVERGQVVKIILNSGALHLTTKGVAKMNGGKGQMVRVRNINSKKLIYCRVAAPGIVEAQL